MIATACCAAAMCLTSCAGTVVLLLALDVRMGCSGLIGLCAAKSGESFVSESSASMSSGNSAAEPPGPLTHGDLLLCVGLVFLGASADSEGVGCVEGLWWHPVCRATAAWILVCVIGVQTCTCASGTAPQVAAWRRRVSVALADLRRVGGAAGVWRFCGVAEGEAGVDDLAAEAEWEASRMDGR